MNYQTSISFGLVNIPVFMNSSIKNNDISFNMLHKKCGERLEYVRYCPHCKSKVKSSEIVKGYEYSKGDYVVFTDDDFDKLKSENDKILEIITFVNISEIDPIYFEKTYTLTPNKSTRAFNLFREALRKSKKCAIARTYMRNKAFYCVIRFGYENVLMDTLYYEEEIKLQKEKTKSDTDLKEVNMAIKLIDAMSGKFEPSKYTDEYQTMLRKAIDKKIKGEELKPRKVKRQKSVGDIMSALSKSLKEINDKK